MFRIQNRPGYTLHAQCENARLLAELAAARAARRAESASATATKKTHPEGGLTDKRKKLSKLPAKKVGIHGSFDSGVMFGVEESLS